MKKFLLLSIILLTVGCTNTKTQKVPNYIEEMYALGYSKETVTALKEKLTEEELDKVTEYDYVEVLLDIINDPDYKSGNFEKYLTYYEDGMNASAVVYIVNNDINYTYNEKLLSLMNHKYFIANNLERYMKVESEDIDEIIRRVNTNIDREFYTEINPTDLTKKELIITNKYYKLDENYVDPNLVTMSTKYSNKSGQKLNKEAYLAFQKLVNDGEKEGVYIRNLSAYRTYKYQNGLYNSYLKEHGLAWTDKWSARPGHSEHQTGLALDVTAKNKSNFEKFEDTEEFEWIKDNAHHYGFIMRYPKNKTEITGYGYEPWHYRYVGIDAANYIYENDITFEEYYAYYVERES